MNKKKKPSSRLHPDSKFHGRYDLDKLQEVCPELSEFVFVNDYNSQTVNFHDPKAVTMLNKALLTFHYGIGNWEVPEDYLCPPIPGRADYIYHIAELLSANNFREIPKITCLDIGTGSSCIYPIIGASEYNWNFIGTDIDIIAIKSAQAILDKNESIKENVELRLQDDLHSIFKGIVESGDKIDMTICNPPFHASPEEAKASSIKKIKNLTNHRNKDTTQNFGGKSNELWTPGGEVDFIKQMIRESKTVSGKCYFFSTLVSRKENLKEIYDTLKEEKAFYVKTIPMGQGNKISRIVAWTFLTLDQQEKWKKENWNK
ncbi:23S rRNA (adenine(1618)-N(6))-methyltransferase RlmF [Flavobacteriales bacterium]|nr:23S rRNA (adenine(1618)-N(6))-methyltransferase RlmF [Flavobacteriales bacterium]